MKENKTSKFSAILGKVGLSPISLVAFIVLGLSPLLSLIHICPLTLKVGFTCSDTLDESFCDAMFSIVKRGVAESGYQMSPTVNPLGNGSVSSNTYLQ